MGCTSQPKGILLLSFGGPDSLAAVEPFMTSIMGGRKPPAPLVERMVERYRLIGGKSPLPEVMRQQAQLIEQELNTERQTYRCYVGTLHWHPLIKDTLVNMVQDGVSEAVALSLSPYVAGVTNGAYTEAIESARAELDLPLKFTFPGSWYDHPLLIEALADNLSAALERFDPVSRSAVEIIFSAHSLPQAHIAGGDPYLTQLEGSIAALVAKTGLKNWQLAFQSKGGGHGKWLGPEVEAVMDKLAAQGKKDVLVVPIGFTTDHIETLYDIDVAQKNHAAALGLNFQRAAALNTSAKFIHVLSDVALNAF